MGRPARQGQRRHSLRKHLLTAAFVLLANAAPAAETIVGRASVIDGDTIDIHGERVRLDGIDAPESWQRCEDRHGKSYRCGRVAALALDSFLAISRPTRCEFVERDRYGRFVGRCFRADGVEANRWMVRQGHALDWPRYSKGRYANEQAVAKRAGSGMWRGTFVAPWEARRLKR